MTIINPMWLVLLYCTKTDPHLVVLGVVLVIELCFGYSVHPGHCYDAIRVRT
jgi:hypothetical protein